MSNQPVYSSEQNKKLWEAADEYFAKAGTDSNENTRLIQPVINALGGTLVLVVCTQWVIEAIEHKGSESIRLAALMPGEILDLQTFAVAEKHVPQLKDVIRTEGYKAGSSLAANLHVSQDEDEQALNAFLLVDFLPTLEPLPTEVVKSLLKSHLDFVEGTSCKMAIAWALYNMGEKKYWEELVYGDFFMKSDFVKIVEKVAGTINPKLNKKEIKDLVCRSFATGEYVKLTPFPIPEIQRKNLLRLLALDIASNGKAFVDAPKWTRKSKNQ